MKGLIINNFQIKSSNGDTGVVFSHMKTYTCLVDFSHYSQTGVTMLGQRLEKHDGGVGTRPKQFAKLRAIVSQQDRF